jgi:hypothetical protein
MNIKQIFNITFYAAILTMSMSVLFPNWVFANSHQTKDNKQETTINLTSDDLKQSYLLKINGSNGFKGNIKLNGKTIKKIVSNFTEIRLSSLLKTGKNILEITGIATSSEATLQVELIGTNTQVTQGSGGNGNIKHILVIYVDKSNTFVDNEDE